MRLPSARPRPGRVPPPRFAAAAAASVLAMSLVGCATLFRQGTIVYLAAESALGGADIEIQIRRSFLERYADRIVIDTSFTVDEARSTPNPNFADGDLHFAGRTPSIGLPTVGEIANAASHPKAVIVVDQAARSGQPLRVRGVWRVWPEHAGTEDEEQGQGTGPVQSTNPDHVFEIHPVTWIGDLDLRGTFHPVPGFSPGKPDRVFDIYQHARCRLRVHPHTVSIVTEKGLYNDAEFVMEVGRDRQRVVRDGRFVWAGILDDAGKILVPRCRMVFARGTPPEAAVRALGPGDRLRVYGIPRVSFAILAQRLKESERRPEVLADNLPYEMIILGVYQR